MIYLINPNKKQYKANLHCHSVLSDGKKTPLELKKMYKSNGYSVLSITDHERPYCHKDLTDKDFIMLTGYEAYIRPNGGEYNRYEKEIHLNLFAREVDNVNFICFNEDYAKYAKRDNALDTFNKVGSTRPRELTTKYVNEFIQTAKENGYIVTYNHPYWSMESEEEILSYDGYFSLEIVNYSSYLINFLENNAPLYDKMLLAGKRVFCHGSDDNHNSHPLGDPSCDSFGAFTMIIPEEFSYSGIFNALESGESYASMDPIINEVSINGDTLHLECSEVTHAFVYMGSKSPARVHAINDDSPFTSADFKIHEDARYVRVAIVDKNGKWAHTRGYFREEFGFKPLKK